MARTPQDDQLGFTFGTAVPEPASERAQQRERAHAVPLSIAAPPRVEAAVPVRKVWRVGEIVSTIRGTVERNFADVWLEGEISNYRPAESGHMYFTLKDGEAQIRVVMFRSAARLLRFRPENGMTVIARGRVTIYDARGELQINAEFLEPKGAGALQVAFEQLKAKLAAEGLFDQERKRPLPMLPRTIGIVTSPRGAALQDILNILRRRHEDVHIIIYPAQVQGESAAAEVAAGVRHFNSMKLADVIIVTRGGGSIEDLAAFNDETLARTIAASKLPVISAVGHEIDFTIADFVADLRAPTPSAAAELVIESKHLLERRTEDLFNRLRQAGRYRLLVAQRQVERLTRSRAFEQLRSAMQRRQQRVDELTFRLREIERGKIQQLRQRVEIAVARVRHFDVRSALEAQKKERANIQRRLDSAVVARLKQVRARLERDSARLKALSPMRILDRGYALVFDASGALVKDAAQVKAGAQIETRLAKGRIESVITKTDLASADGDDVKK